MRDGEEAVNASKQGLRPWPTTEYGRQVFAQRFGIPVDKLDAAFGYADRIIEAEEKIQAATRAINQTIRDGVKAGFPRGLLCLEIERRREERGPRKADAFEPSLVYFARLVGHDLVKIGVSVDVPTRLKALERSGDFRIDYLGTVDGDHLAEEAIHYQFAKHRVRRFDLTEMFVLSAIEQDVMSMIMRNSAVLETRQ